MASPARTVGALRGDGRSGLQKASSLAAVQGQLTWQRFGGIRDEGEAEMHVVQCTCAMSSFIENWSLKSFS